MARFFKKRIENQGMPPGSLIFIGTQKVETPFIKYRDFNARELNLEKVLDTEELPQPKKHKTQWYNVIGLHDTQFMEKVSSRLHIHPLAMEDVMNTGQRAKFEEFNEHLFITLKMLRFQEDELMVNSEQISFILNHDFLATFQEADGDTFDPIRSRLQRNKGMIRNSGPDYLTYALLDSIVDNYIYLIESMGEKIDDLELKVLDNTEKDILRQINAYKRELHFILKVVKPVRELLANLIKSQSVFIRQEQVLPYFKDLEGLVTHAIESVETYRTLLTDYLTLYHSGMSTKMNDIMKVLTIFSAIFIPLSFFAGVYGTNFQNLPELEYEYSYFIFWGVMVSMAVGMLFYFKQKDWF
jgi:magnesium transporter